MSAGSQAPHKTSSDERTLGIKLQFEALHQVEIGTGFSPHADEPLEIDRATLNNQAAASLLCFQTKFRDCFHQAASRINRSQFDIEDAISAALERDAIRS